MRNEAFYTTAAQVLPTLLIAIAVEANLLTPGILATTSKWILLRAVILGFIFMAGETASIAMLFLGTGGWLPWVAGPLTVLAILALSMYTVVLPILRLIPSRAATR